MGSPAPTDSHHQRGRDNQGQTDPLHALIVGSRSADWKRTTRSPSLEGVPRMAVVGADLHVGVTGGSRGLPLLTLANGTLMARPALFSEFFDHGVGVGAARVYDLVALGEVQAVREVLPLDTETHLPDAR